jgi:hypothetical protein
MELADESGVRARHRRTGGYLWFQSEFFPSLPAGLVELTVLADGVSKTVTLGA